MLQFKIVFTFGMSPLQSMAHRNASVVFTQSRSSYMLVIEALDFDEALKQAVSISLDIRNDSPFEIVDIKVSQYRKTRR